MLSGNLAEVGLEGVLAHLADGATSGCLHLLDPAGGQARVYVQVGQVYAVSTGTVPSAAATLRTQVADLLTWPAGTWRLRLNERTDAGADAPVPLAELLVGLPAPDTQHGPEVDRPELAEVHRAVARVSTALAAVLGPGRDLDDAFDRPLPRRDDPPAAAPPSEVAPTPEVLLVAAVAPDLDVPPTPEVAPVLSTLFRPAPQAAAFADPVPGQDTDDLPDPSVEADLEAALASLAHPPLAQPWLAQPLSAQPPSVPPAPTLPADEPFDAPTSAQFAALVNELSTAASSAPSAGEPARAEPEPAVEPAAGPKQQADEPYARADTDMASLLRELSSLGLEDVPAPVQSRPPTPPPAPQPVAKKKKGLFGF
jgi:hypothetical protein